MPSLKHTHTHNKYTLTLTVHTLLIVAIYLLCVYGVCVGGFVGVVTHAELEVPYHSQVEVVCHL